MRRRHVPSRGLALAIAAATIVISASAARRRRVTAVEANVFRRCNHATDAFCAPAWTVMQFGSLGAVGATAAVTAARRGCGTGAVVAVTGGAVWSGVKLIKPGIGRGRPTAYIADVRLRGAPQAGLGYPSGHAAVAATLAVLTTHRRRTRVAALGAACAVGCARMYTGAHLPADVIGGLAIGSLAGVLVRSAVDAG